MPAGGRRMPNIAAAPPRSLARAATSRYLAEKGYTTAEIAARLRVTRRTVRRYLRGA